ncbi:hypothetical protein Aph01nite_17730 [Acrocarpospora phusangensis]|uniref:Vegetative cell wall protein gp1 n=1 Tax=Acrocarpospora phusangensis TaxID=1070424 RepID=A0A919UMM5_9ACTN|nr:hypothetical protein [Acrocarpospora phusangensis]GIH23463.1 hypothetical protein Aph01nite_17730 [Acrocarpospora phusangensis]
MSALLGEIGRKLADVWFTLLVLPGALYLAVATAAYRLGHARPFDIGALAGDVTTFAAGPAARSAGGQALLLVAALAVAAIAGLAAQGLGSLLERIVLAADWRAWYGPLFWLADRRVARRRKRWQARAAIYHRLREDAALARARGGRPDSSPRRAAGHAMNRVAVEEPDRPTWTGDRVHAVAVRLERDHQLDLAVVWPHLWLTLPDPVRAEITAARQSLARATTLGGWAILYALLTVWWWPAGLLAVVLAGTARHRTRGTVDVYARLLEAATRLHAGELARRLGLEHDGPLTPEVGDALTRLLHSEPPMPAAIDR